ncbi:UDP-N-acetylmuramoyl-L-alanyl-D-glutamate--2,6-diaminopimelate ligase [Lentzea sp. NBRC 105346]|uniref:UDP-N-acetylmuramoyl-L-alanyl-D-glutamate--2, 6-diaminopimelate ligase n=1 Tax=Lentzea sp. NBRC 105346 TaxID=3032205 RepID=UPI0025550194|nr:UDP-N-acetylmuramoyl-L-alanyl-D-glutamate--2,6-diaminopimelate ligase [Lentzea sp. NBRC 105346]
MPAKLEGKVATAPPRPTSIKPVSVAALATIGDAHLTGPAHADVQVTGVTLRAQHVVPGDLYAALPGSRAHGADFAGTAIEHGAVAVLTDEVGAAKIKADVPVLVHDNPRSVVGLLAAHVYGNPSTKTRVWGVTGTSGKTTTSYLIESALRAAGRSTGLIGTVEMRIGTERIDSALTTPESPDLQALFAVMAERGITDVVMEVSSHALELGRVAATEFEIGAFTNLSQDHLDFHPDMEDYFRAKAKLFDGRARKEVVCVDSEWGERLVNDKTITVATTKNATWTASDVEVSPTGEQTFTAHGPDGDIAIELRLPGSFNVANALLAIGCLHLEGVDKAAIAEGLKQVQVPGRMQRVDEGQDFTAVVDYSHKPVAVALALDAVRSKTAGRIITVLGCGGDRDKGKRPLMGEAAAQRSDVLIITDDNPRSEEPSSIRAAMLEGALKAEPRGEVVEIGDRGKAIEHAVSLARTGDVVVVAGKGHETGQEIAGVVHPFSDVETLAAAIRKAHS